MRINPLQIILFTLIIPISIYSQIGHGFSFDNYNGIYGSVTNPANTAQSKYRWHVNAISYNQLGISDFGAIDYFNIESNPTGFNGLNFEEHIDKGEINDNIEKYLDMSIKELKEKCIELGLKHSGNKHTLANRIVDKLK